MAIITNLRLIKRSRRGPAAGDIFAMLLPTNRYLFGRVVLAEPPREQAPTPSANLIYIYSYQSEMKQTKLRYLMPGSLLMAPVWTNRLGWTKGYFETLGNKPLYPTALLSQHCFRRHDGVFLDERGRRLARRHEPCGEWGLASYRWIDDHVSDAVGIPRAPIVDDD